MTAVCGGIIETVIDYSRGGKPVAHVPKVEHMKSFGYLEFRASVKISNF